MLPKTTITAAILGAALSFMIIGATEAQATHSPFPDPFEEIAIAYCQANGLVWINHECVVEFGPIAADPGVVVVIAIPEETASAIETPQIEVETPVVSVPADPETAPELGETDPDAPESTPDAGSDDPEPERESIRVATPDPSETLTPEHENNTDSAIEGMGKAPSNSITKQVEKTVDSLEDTDVLEHDDTEAAQSDSLTETQTEVPANEMSGSTGTSSVLAALLGAMGAVALFGAVVLGVVIGRRAN